MTPVKDTYFHMSFPIPPTILPDVRHYLVRGCGLAGVLHVCDKPGLPLTGNGQALCGAPLQETGRLQRRCTCVVRYSAVLSLALQ
jgi:hypothetical protein